MPSLLFKTLKTGGAALIFGKTVRTTAARVNQLKKGTTPFAQEKLMVLQGLMAVEAKRGKEKINKLIYNPHLPQ